MLTKTTIPDKRTDIPNGIRLVLGGHEYFSLIEQMINDAVVSIHLQVYILGYDVTGRRVIECLIKAARRGVIVYLLLDGYASQGLPGDVIREMKDAGIFFSWFEPLFKSRKFFFGRRLHHKVLVVDGSKALVGGINITDKYNEVNGHLPWLDMALYAEGDVAQTLGNVCGEIWHDCTGIAPANYSKTSVQRLRDSRLFPVSVSVRRNDWLMGRRQIWKSYANLIANAQEDIIIVCSYFLPGWTFRKLMAKAAQRGVSIRIIVAGPSDIWIAKQAERFLYYWMLKNGIRLFEYQKSILHAKVAVADGKYLTLGSFNINNISAYASIELNLDVRSKPFVSNVKVELEHLIEKDCIEILPDHSPFTRNWLRRFWQRSCYEAIKVILYLFTFYYHRERTSFAHNSVKKRNH